jgi:hypothetical protein
MAMNNANTYSELVGALFMTSEASKDKVLLLQIIHILDAVYYGGHRGMEIYSVEERYSLRFMLVSAATDKAKAYDPNIGWGNSITREYWLDIIDKLKTDES